MDGVVTILEEPYHQAVKEIWQDLAQACGLKAVQAMAVPHFSWHVAQAYPDEERLNALLEQAAYQYKPFSVRTAGLGFFFHPNLVVYLPLVKTQALINLHQWLWDQIMMFSDQPNPLYAPNSWMPHITLVYEDLSGTELQCVLERLSYRRLDWEIQVSNLALIGQFNDASHPVCIQHTLCGEMQA